MAVRLARLAFCGLLGWATYFIATSTIGLHHAVGALAAVAVAIAAAYQLGILLGDRFGLNRQKTKDNVHLLLRMKLVEFCDDDLFPGIATRVSLHAWEVPAWYRRLAPYKARQWGKNIFSEERVKRSSWKPDLDLVHAERFHPLPPLGIRFRKGIGLVGVCIESNRSGEALHFNFESAAILALMAAGEEAWRNARLDQNYGLDLRSTKQLAARYSQAVGVVIQDPQTGEAVGCLTLEVPPGSGVVLQENDDVEKRLKALAEVLAGAIIIK